MMHQGRKVLQKRTILGGGVHQARCGVGVGVHAGVDQAQRARPARRGDQLLSDVVVVGSPLSGFCRWSTICEKNRVPSADWNIAVRT